MTEVGSRRLLELGRENQIKDSLVVEILAQ